MLLQLVFSGASRFSEVAWWVLEQEPLLYQRWGPVGQVFCFVQAAQSWKVSVEYLLRCWKQS